MGDLPQCGQGQNCAWPHSPEHEIPQYLHEGAAQYKGPSGWPPRGGRPHGGHHPRQGLQRHHDA
eukprot:3777043-Pyramimonas_sp.AAC.1